MTIPELAEKMRAARLLAQNAQARYRDAEYAAKAARDAADQKRTDWDNACQLQAQAERELLEAVWSDVELP